MTKANPSQGVARRSEEVTAATLVWVTSFLSRLAYHMAFEIPMELRSSISVSTRNNNAYSDSGFRFALS